VKVADTGDKIDYTHTVSGEVIILDVDNIEVLFMDPINL